MFCKFFQKNEMCNNIETLKVGQRAHIYDPKTLSNMTVVRNKDGGYDMQLPPFNFENANSVVDSLEKWLGLKEGQTEIDFKIYEDNTSYRP